MMRAEKLLPVPWIGDASLVGQNLDVLNFLLKDVEALYILDFDA